MADDKGRSRRSFLGELLTGAAGGWVALTGSTAVSAFLAACSRQKGTSAKKDPEMQTKYGGPAMEPPDQPMGKGMDMDAPARPMDMDGPARPMGMDMDPEPGLGGLGKGPGQATKYGGRSNVVNDPPRKRPRRPRPRPKKYGGRRTKYGGPRRTKYGGSAIIKDL